MLALVDHLKCSAVVQIGPAATHNKYTLNYATLKKAASSQLDIHRLFIQSRNHIMFKKMKKFNVKIFYTNSTRNSTYNHAAIGPSQPTT